MTERIGTERARELRRGATRRQARQQVTGSSHMASLVRGLAKTVDGLDRWLDAAELSCLLWTTVWIPDLPTWGQQDSLPPIVWLRHDRSVPERVRLFVWGAQVFRGRGGKLLHQPEHGCDAEQDQATGCSVQTVLFKLDYDNGHAEGKIHRAHPEFAS